MAINKQLRLARNRTGQTSPDLSKPEGRERASIDDVPTVQPFGATDPIGEFDDTVAPGAPL